MADETFSGGAGIPGHNPASAANERLESSKSHAQQAAEDLKAAAQHKAEEFRGHAETAWDDAQHRARSFQADTERYVRDNPTRSVLYALGIGFVLGVMMRR